MLYGGKQTVPALEAAAAEPLAMASANDLEQVFRAHHALVFRAAFRITGNATDAEDVLQTVFLRLMRREYGAEAVGNYESYLRRAAVNTALDVVRNRHQATTVPVESVELHLTEDRRQEPDRQHDASEIRELVRKAIARLSPRAAEMFALRYLEGHGNREIARLMGVSQAGLAVTLHRTKKQLQKEIRSLLGARHEH